MPEWRIRLADFIGNWSVARQIDDRTAGATLHFLGTATFTPDPAGLTYAEAGRLALPDGTTLAAERRYLWRESEDGIAVLFADGRPFHSFGTANPLAAHWCDPDTYRVAYDFAAWPAWSATWDVTGPRKDYRMRSHYSR
jgi:hypothetical protein